MRFLVFAALTGTLLAATAGAGEELYAETHVATPFGEESTTLSPEARALPPGTKVAVIEFARGNVEIHLFPEETPLTAGNFIRLVAEGFYDGIPVHRVEDFVVQAGDPTRVDRELPDLELELEPDARECKRGIMSMARYAWYDEETGERVYGATSPTQFFILKLDTPRLDPDFCVFGAVVAGMEVVDAVEVDDVIERLRIVTVGAE
jgi:cyclophilin family peptidyl-prolyl cis-trans isomerase